MVRPRPGVNVHATLTQFESKEENGTFLKRKVRLCALGDQQIKGESFNTSDLYDPAWKAPETRPHLSAYWQQLQWNMVDRY